MEFGRKRKIALEYGNEQAKIRKERKASSKTDDSNPRSRKHGEGVCYIFEKESKMWDNWRLFEGVKLEQSGSWNAIAHKSSHPMGFPKTLR